MNTTNNTILITGGGSGIGRGLAEAFHALGNQVIISGRSQSKLDETAGANPGMKSLTVDMGDAGSLREFAAKVTEQFPTLHVLINMAGIMKNEKLLALAGSFDVAEETVATNLLGPMRLTSLLLPHLVAQPHATIMNVTSGLAFVPLAMTPAYSATKAAIHSYTQALRYQLKDTSVEVLELIPPYVATSLMGDRQANDPMAMPLEDYISEVMSLIGQDPTPSEIAVERVLPQRLAEASGGYDAFFQAMNDRLAAARASEF